MEAESAALGPLVSSGALSPDRAGGSHLRRTAGIEVSNCGEIARQSLRRSRARRDVLRFVVERGPVCLTEIARGTGIDPPGVTGAVRGLGEKFSSASSLLALGLLAVLESGRLKSYVATDEGRRALVSLSLDSRGSSANRWS